MEYYNVLYYKYYNAVHANIMRILSKLKQFTKDL